MKRSKNGQRLILWDIDGTLIDSGHAGIYALRRASVEMLGPRGDDLDGVEIAGRTDPGIVRQILQKHDIAITPERTDLLLDRYVELLPAELKRRNGHVLPGVRELLEYLADRPEISLGLLTGNVARGAQLKLEYYGLWNFFSFGAFADNHHDRNELGAVACARAEEKTGRTFAADRVDVIGDTGHDIACGQAIGARTIAVATGSWPRQRLANAGPDFLFDDFSENETVRTQLDW
jgi:phosphoglycolate phosphatase-like HAD superfamily hydrolase